MLAMLKIPLFVLVAACLGSALCMVLKIPVHNFELIVSAGIAVVAAELALVPMFFMRHGNQAAVAQGALVGTMVHLFGFAIATAIIFLGKFPVHPALSYWLMAMYFATLIALVLELVRQVKAAPVASAKQ
jgi:hypothetical protein